RPAHFLDHGFTSLSLSIQLNRFFHDAATHGWVPTCRRIDFRETCPELIGLIGCSTLAGINFSLDKGLGAIKTNIKRSPYLVVLIIWNARVPFSRIRFPNQTEMVDIQVTVLQEPICAILERFLQNHLILLI